MCAKVGAEGDGTYMLVGADAGATIRASVAATGPGGTTTVYARATIGPVRSMTAAAAGIAAVGGRAALRTPGGGLIATVVVRAPGGARAAAAGAAGPPAAVVTVRPARSLRGGWKVWACPKARTAEWQPCGRPAALRTGRVARLRVALRAGERVQVVCVRRPAARRR